jgi:DNA repair protein RadA/Sms
VAMLLAVMERRLKMKFSTCDVYVSTVGGIRLTEPGADLAIALALASALRDIPLSNTLAVVGEVSLAGEIRPASNGKQRLAEARRLGYTSVLDARTGRLGDAVAAAFTATPSGLVGVPDDSVSEARRAS